MTVCDAPWHGSCSSDWDLMSSASSPDVDTVRGHSPSLAGLGSADSSSHLTPINPGLGDEPAPGSGELCHQLQATL